MLYTLIGNGTANNKEVLASLESLRTAVADAHPFDEADDFWMVILDPVGEDLSSTMEGIVAWAQGLGLYYEVVVSEGAEVSPSLKTADEIHVARRPYDFAVKLTKSRIQPEEKSAILVLSNSLDSDENALYTIERAITDGIPVYDLGGQMVQVLLEEDTLDGQPPEDESPSANEPPPYADHEAGALFGSPPNDEPDFGQDTPLTPEDKALVGDFLNQVAPPVTQVTDEEAMEAGKTKEDVSLSKPLVLTRLMLEDLSRDELKHLVRTYDVQDQVTDMRSREAMIVALLGEVPVVESVAEMDPALPKSVWTDGSATFNTPAEVSSITIIPWDTAAPDPAATIPMHYYVQILPDGTPMMSRLSQDVVDLLLTLLADA